MASYLTLLGCDSVIVTGTTTSGCVRATVLDAFSLNYRIALAEEGCFDRSQASHAINLCDMNAKYADVVKTSGGAPVLRQPARRHVRPAEGIGRTGAQAQDGRELLSASSSGAGIECPARSGAFRIRRMIGRTRTPQISFDGLGRPSSTCPHHLEIGELRLHLLDHGVHVAEAALERIALEDRVAPAA
jgi:hypothetical protein